MKTQRLIISLASITCLATGCGTKTASNPSVSRSTETAASPVTATTEVSGMVKDPAPVPFADPIAPAATSSTLPAPSLIPPTTSLARLPQVDAGRTDPFAALAVTPTVVESASVAPAVPSAPLPAVPVATVPVSVGSSMAAPPALPTLLPVPANLQRLPSGDLPNRVTPTRSLAQTVEISGVIQVGGKTNVIVQELDQPTSRYVRVGEYLNNGKVLVKRVQMGAEPVVILEQDGKEVARSIGSGNSVVGAL